MENEYKREQYKKILFRFLKDNGAYKSFFINFNNRFGCMHNFEDIFDLIDFCIKYKMPTIIDQAFIWRKTKEGPDFWRSLNDKFIDVCEETNIFK